MNIEETQTRLMRGTETLLASASFFGYCEKKLDFLMRSAYTVCTDSKIEFEIAKQ